MPKLTESGVFRKGNERAVAQTTRGAVQTTAATGVSIFLIELARWAGGWDIPVALGAAFTGFCVILGNALGRLSRSRIGQAFEDWIVRHLEQS